jgi:YHS domain-containing protein
MSTAAPVRAHAEPASPIASSADSSVEQLVQRLTAEVDAAAERVHSLQTEAAKVFVGQEQRLTRFVAVADRIHAVLLPRLEAFTNVDVFQDITQSTSLELRGSEGRGFHGRTITLTIPCSDKRPATMKFSFRVGHDGPLENAVMEYRLEILPIFIKFDSHDQLVIPFDEPSEETICAWIDDKLVGFTRTYFDVYFNVEYQKKSLEMDPVLDIRFPRSLAVATTQYQSRTYHFYTEESFQRFEKDPSEYIGLASQSSSDKT